ncbi:hypothetical protein [Nocardia sp. NPDC050710]|uniref:hypothetical protein n=1 Tax=Nocardia sp. NPDC050710 TaxID=3157220 RepID=UPI0034102B99
MTTDQHSTRRTRRSLRARVVAAAFALLGVGLVTASVARADQEPNPRTCSSPNLACGQQPDRPPGGHSNLTPDGGSQNNLTPGGGINLTPGPSTGFHGR